MPIKIEGLCGIVRKRSMPNPGLYILLPEVKNHRNASSVRDKQLVPHFPRVLIEFNKLDSASQEKTPYRVRHRDGKEYGLFLLDNSLPTFDLSGSSISEIENVRSNFVETNKLYTDDSSKAKLNENLLKLDIKNPIDVGNSKKLKLACRFFIDKGTLEGENDISPAQDIYSFSFNDSNVDNSYKPVMAGGSTKGKNFHPILKVENVQINKINIASVDYVLSNPLAIVRIENLPTVPISANDGDKDIDFELAYDFIPNSPKKIPTIHKSVSMFRPLICALAWFPDIT